MELQKYFVGIKQKQCTTFLKQTVYKKFYSDISKCYLQTIKYNC